MSSRGIIVKRWFIAPLLVLSCILTLFAQPPALQEVCDCPILEPTYLAEDGSLLPVPLEQEEWGEDLIPALSSGSPIFSAGIVASDATSAHLLMWWGNNLGCLRIAD